MASHNFKAPPALSKSSSYENWLKELAIWQKFTDIKKENHGSGLFLTLEGKAREAALELPLDSIASENGVKNIIAKLDTLFLKDKVQTAYEAYEKFEKFQRPSDMSMSDYMIEFERLLSKTKSHGTTMSSDILAYRLLNSANLPEQQKQLARATVGDLTYEQMKSQLKKIFGDSSATDSENSALIKIEPTYQSQLEHDTWYGQGYGQGYGRRGSNRARPPFQRGSFRGVRGSGGGARGGHRGSGNRSLIKGRNPVDEYGNITKCSVCSSVNHWAASCPDGQYYSEVCEEEYVDPNHEVTLYQSNLITEDCMKVFVAESIGCAILDSGATSTVSGKKWMDIYCNSLSPDRQAKINYYDSTNSFKFGSGEVYKSLYKMSVPATIGKKNIHIETDIVELDIPMLLSKSSMKRAQTEINFKDDTVKMLGQVQDISLTTSGHYAVSLNEKKQILDDVTRKGASITLNVQDHSEDKWKTAHKLHYQFSHPHPNKLIDLVNRAGMGNDRELLTNIKEVSRNCKVCKEFRKPEALPVVGLPMATEFNEVVAMDIKFLNGKMILHLIDHLTRYSAAALLNSKKPEEIVNKIFQIWICVFGPPSKFLSDNGGEFNNDLFRELCGKYNIIVKTTAAEAPWSNGLCERHNAVLADTVIKTMADSDCSMELALNWALHSKNSLSNVHGFSPYQLAIGYNPKLPSALHNRPPAMEQNQCAADIVSKHLSTMGAARKAFVESENSERVKRAMRHNMKPNSTCKFVTGDSVYYKRMDCKKWKGPGKVIGQESQQILIKHGGIYVRVHPCRVMLEKESESTQSNSVGRDCANEVNRQPQHETETSNELTTAEDTDDSSESTPENPEESAGSSRITSDVNNGHSIPVNSPSTPRSNTSGKINHGLLKRDSKIMYKTQDDDEWTRVTVVSRAGKATGKYKHNWNVLKDGEEVPVELDFENQVYEWKFQDLYSTDEIQQCEIYLAQVNKEVDDAKHMELENWKREEVYEEVSDEGQEAMSVRWVVTPKIVDGEKRTKARLVARGFEEDTSNLRTDSPTCMKDSLRLMLAVAASNSWSLNSIDIKAAFLQGNPIERELFLRPPKEANQSGKLWRLKKAVYGLSDASRIWYLRVHGELLKHGATASKYDKAVFTWKHNGNVQGILAAHVDDFLWVGTDNFVKNVIDPLRNTFKVSTESKDCFKYVGININKSGPTIKLDQKPYIESLNPADLHQFDVKDKESELERPGVRAFRGLVGQMNWVANISRPDMCFSACELSTLQSKPTAADLIKANKTIKELKSDDVEISFKPLNTENAKLVVFADASYGNLRDGGSQGGSIIFLYDGEHAIPLSWSSHKLKRIARSTLCAETLAAVEAVDNAYLLSAIGGELLNQERLQIDLYTDNRSLFDAVNTTNAMLDKRMRVDIAALREMSEKNEVKFMWVETKFQLADVLTKKEASKRKVLDALQHSQLLLE